MLVADLTASHCQLTSLTESDCSRMRSKFSSDWLPSYIKATRPVLVVFKMAGYTSDSSRNVQITNKMQGEFITRIRHFCNDFTVKMAATAAETCW